MNPPATSTERLKVSREKSRWRPARWIVAALVVAAGAIVFWPRPSAEKLVEDARRAMQGGQWSRAAELLEAVGWIRAHTPTERLLLADADDRLGRSERAVERLAAIPDDDPSAAAARLLAGQIERRRNRMRAAEAALLEAARLDPQLAQARRELVFMYGMQGRRIDLSAQFKRLVTLVPLTTRELMIWTVSNEDIWINSSIEGDLERYLDADPEDRLSRVALAEVLLRSGDAGRAESVLAPLPDADVDARALRARIALDRAQLDRASTLLEGGPADHPVIARLRGQLALRRNDLPGAVEALRTAVRLDPNNQEAVQALALALKRSGLDAEAEPVQAHAERLRALTRLLEEARSTEGRTEQTLPKRLARACEAIGALDQARAWYGLALQVDVLDPEVQRAVHRLAKQAEEGGEPGQRP